jgi:hypothetical protein
VHPATINDAGPRGPARPSRALTGHRQQSVPSGSYLVFSDGTNVIDGGQGEAAQGDYNDSGAEPYCLRSPEQIRSGS